jgi:hypothetical protein
MSVWGVWRRAGPATQAGDDHRHRPSGDCEQFHLASPSAFPSGCAGASWSNASPAKVCTVGQGRGAGLTLQRLLVAYALLCQHAAKRKRRWLPRACPANMPNCSQGVGTQRSCGCGSAWPIPPARPLRSIPDQDTGGAWLGSEANAGGRARFPGSMHPPQGSQASEPEPRSAQRRRSCRCGFVPSGTGQVSLRPRHGQPEGKRRSIAPVRTASPCGMTGRTAMT